MIHIINIQIVIIVSGEENDLDIRVDPKQVIGQSDPGLITKLDIDESQIIVLAFCSSKALGILSSKRNLGLVFLYNLCNNNAIF